MLTSRQANILKIIVEEYTKTAQPVGSKTIMEADLIDASSATIRNDCALLEKEGFLEKEHASSGRIPSTKGYRYYVDNLMHSKNIDDIKNRIELLFSNRNMTINDILDQTGQILSEMTNLTTVVVGPNFQEERLKKLELLPISDKQTLIIFVLSNGHVQNKLFTIDDNISIEDLQISIELFNTRLENTKLNELSAKFEVIRPILEQQVQHHEYILKQFANALTSIIKPSYSTHGMQYMLQNPEYNNPERIKQIIQFIENVSPFNFFKKVQNGKSNAVSIQIGNEIQLDNGNDDVALLSTTYKVDNVQEGGIALVGPKRLEYDKVHEILEWLANKIRETYQE
ncbi:heat-inducible transcriptional repressor HrcA [Spiroplasma chrysopicola]|uniref:Heat-inducible transcription repressor HrcA n=1 Tax=Spiroplasma chrysopicola DF-1 TaxID=1276227 RepID=R4U4B3_9MOLU|nr:heat-inducible transcriptional repressor HrcA [Spiroplasma chrysopicola]AGM25408.1 heat-inducible transcription repressor [Spiroplasma chrysopicola DF-1]